jgi:predicted  nucleic acid-binding Zn-ribbon protein
MEQQLENKERYLIELKESYQNLQNSTTKQNEQLSDKFNKERREMNERIEQLSSEVAKRERAILSLENAKEGFQNNMSNKEKAFEELRTEFQNEKLGLHNKIEELK